MRMFRWRRPEWRRPSPASPVKRWVGICCRKIRSCWSLFLWMIRCGLVFDWKRHRLHKWELENLNLQDLFIFIVSFRPPAIIDIFTEHKYILDLFTVSSPFRNHWWLLVTWGSSTRAKEKVFLWTRRGKWPQRTSLSVFAKVRFISLSSGPMLRLYECLHCSGLWGNSKSAIVSLNVVSSGEVLGLLGPNGAGKSTIMHMLSGDTDPTAGQVQSR